MRTSTALIFDGNYIFYRALHSTKGFSTRKDSKKKFLEDKDEQNVFVRKVATDFIASVNTFKGVDHVIFTKDSRSWRKDYFDNYKISRADKKESDIDWNIFFKCMDRFCEIISKSGVIVSNINGAEGDDLIYLWSKYFNENDENVIVITADADLSQIVRLKNDKFTVVYNNKSNIKKIIGPINFYEWLQERKKLFKPKSFLDSKAVLMQMMGNDGALLVSNAIDNMNYEEINPNEIALKKIVCGDDMDNIPSIWEWGEIKANGKWSKRITNKDFMKVKDYLFKNEGGINLKNIYKDGGLINKIRITLENSGKTKIDLSEFKSRLDRNFHLVVLNNIFIPNIIQEKFNKVLNNINLNEKIKFMDRISILNGTEFAKEATIQIISDAY